MIDQVVVTGQYVLSQDSLCVRHRLPHDSQVVHGGLDVVRDLSATALRLLRPGGVLVIEHGEAQGGAIRDLLDAVGWRSTVTHPDLTGRDRATTAVR